MLSIILSVYSLSLEEILSCMSPVRARYQSDPWVVEDCARFVIIRYKSTVYARSVISKLEEGLCSFSLVSNSTNYMLLKELSKKVSSEVEKTISAFVVQCTVHKILECMEQNVVAQMLLSSSSDLRSSCKQVLERR